MKNDPVKQAVLWAAAEFEQKYRGYIEGVYAPTDEIAHMLRQALAAYGIVWTFGQRQTTSSEPRRRNKTTTGGRA